MLEKNEECLKRVSDRIEGANVDHAGLSNALLNSAREVYGERKRRKQRETEKCGGGMSKYS